MTFFASVFTIEHMGHVILPQHLFSRRKSEELRQIEVTSDDLLGKLKTNKTPGPFGIPLGVLKEVRCEIIN